LSRFHKRDWRYIFSGKNRA